MYQYISEVRLQLNNGNGGEAFIDVLVPSETKNFKEITNQVNDYRVRIDFTETTKQHLEYAYLGGDEWSGDEIDLCAILFHHKGTIFKQDIAFLEDIYKYMKGFTIQSVREATDEEIEVLAQLNF